MLHLRELLGSMASLLSSFALLMAGTGMFNTFIALHADLAGFSTDSIGYLMSCYYAGLAVGTFRCPALVNRVGHIRAFAAFSAVYAVCIMVFTLYRDLYLWLFLRALMGVSVAGLLVITESWLNAKANVRTRGVLLSMYMMTSYMFYGGGQLLLNFGDPAGHQLFVLAAILCSVALIPVSVTRASHPDPCEARFFGLRKLYKISPVAVAGCFVSGMLVSGVYGMGPVYARGIGLPLGDIAIFMTIIAVSGLLLQFPVGYLSDRRDRRQVIFGVAALTIVVSIPLAFFNLGGALPLLFLAAVLYGGFSSTVYPLCVSLANDHIEPEDMVQAAGGLVLTYSVGAALGPAVTARLMAVVGDGALFGLAMAMSCALVLYTWRRMQVRTPPPEEEKQPFVPLPEVAAAPVSSEVDPRAEPTESLLEDGDVRSENGDVEYRNDG